MLAIVLAYLIYTGVRSAGMYYMSVSELMAKQTTLNGQKVRLQGHVQSSSIQEDRAHNTLRVAPGHIHRHRREF